MTLKTGYAVLGAVLAAMLTIALYFILGGSSMIAIDFAIVAVLMLVGYIVASLTAATSFGEVVRGWLLGLNAALNIVCILSIVSQFAGLAVGLIVSAVIGVIILLGSIGPISQSGIYQGLIGYLNWLLPMSWLIVAIGALLYVVSLLLHAVTAGKVSFLKVTEFDIDGPTGTIFMKGGLAANLNMLHTAFNMGNFSFVHRDSGSWHKEHEAGHTLNLAAFGTLFHLIGAVDENVLRRGSGAYAERLAESNSSSSGSIIPMWT